MRIAGAPITWGVCEVPGWGHRLPPERVLGEMAQLGLTATELGPEGYLPGEPSRVRELLGRFGLRLVAGFVPAVLEQPDRRRASLEAVEQAARLLAEAGAEVLVLAAAGPGAGYETTRPLGSAAWDRLLEGIDLVRRLASRHGLVATLHPHHGTLVQGPESVQRLLDTSDVPLCLDTGHVLVGGGDAVALAESAAARIRHVHLKDVDLDVAERLRAGVIGYRDAVAAGLYRPLGTGDGHLDLVVDRLQAAGYDGWYVLEQDAVLEGEPPQGGGPIRDAEASLRFLTERAARPKESSRHAGGGSRQRGREERAKEEG